MHPHPILTLSPPPLVPNRVVYLDRLGVEMTHVAPRIETPIVGLRELRGSSQPVPAVIVRRGTL